MGAVVSSGVCPFSRMAKLQKLNGRLKPEMLKIPNCEASGAAEIHNFALIHDEKQYPGHGPENYTKRIRRHRRVGGLYQ